MQTPDASVLIVAPIGEEMNKCRRMLSLAGRACQSAGIGALLVDLTGTGDSAGDFREASLSQWRDDLRRAVRFLQAEGTQRLHVLAVRSGALLVDEALSIEGVVPGRLALWQPVSSGRQVSSQWFRLAQAAELVAGVEGGGEKRARAILDEQGYLEVAGYDLSRDLLRELESLDLGRVLAVPWARVGWFEVVAEAGSPAGPAATRTIDAATARGVDIALHSVVGEPFWATPEIAVVPGLVDATLAFLSAP